MASGSSKRPVRGRHARRSASVEWIGGIAELPTFIDEGEESYRPDVLLWISEDLFVLGSTLAKPEEALRMVGDSLTKAMENPIYGSPHRPTRIRVATTELATALRAAHPSIEVVCAPTPEFDELIGLMADGPDEEGSASYLDSGLEPDEVAALFKALAALFRAAPWEAVPSDHTPISVTIEQLGVRDAAVSVIGQMGESFGLVLFAGRDDFDEYLERAQAAPPGELPDLPPHFVFNFMRDQDLWPELLDEISAHRWEVASPEAYPWLASIASGLVPELPTAEELTVAEAIALALPGLVSERQALRRACAGGEPLSRTLRVTTHAGEVEVTLRIPFERLRAAHDVSGDVLAKMAAISRQEGEIDYDALQAYEGELEARFAASPEGGPFGGFDACGMVTQLAVTYLGETIASLGPAGLQEVLFDLFPRKASIQAARASDIVDELRAFYAFAKREFGMPSADACLRILGKDAAARLERELGDTSKFDMAKQILMAGAAAGVDVHSEEGLAAYMNSLMGKPLPESFRLPDLPSSPRSAPPTRAERNKRKAARKGAKRRK